MKVTVEAEGNNDHCVLHFSNDDMNNCNFVEIYPEYTKETTYDNDCFTVAIDDLKRIVRAFE